MKLPKCFVEEFDNIPEEVDRLIYVRDDTRKRIGVIIINNGECGWSLCHDDDEWDIFTGILTAWERLMEGRSVEFRENEVYHLDKNYKGKMSWRGLKAYHLFNAITRCQVQDN